MVAVLLTFGWAVGMVSILLAQGKGHGEVSTVFPFRGLVWSPCSSSLAGLGHLSLLYLWGDH